MADRRWWLVFAGTRVALVRSETARRARAEALPAFDRGRRRLLPGARPIVRRATAADVVRYRRAEEQAAAGAGALRG